MPEPRVVHIEVHGQRYPIRTTLEAAYVQELAGFVDRKMGLAAEASPSSDMLGLAVLTALNIADEFFRARSQQSDDVDSIAERTAALERMVDQALQLAGGHET
jgi:cell division protein ZapA